MLHFQGFLAKWPKKLPESVRLVMSVCASVVRMFVTHSYFFTQNFVIRINIFIQKLKKLSFGGFSNLELKYFLFHVTLWIGRQNDIMFLI